MLAPSTQSYVWDTSTLTWNCLELNCLFQAQEVTVVKDTGGPSGLVRMTLTLKNLSDSSERDIELFHFADIDVNGMANDSAVLKVHQNIRITNGDGNFAEYKGFNAKAFLVRAFSDATDVAAVLDDGDVDDFDNTGLPFSPGDITAGFQWSAYIPRGTSRSFTVILAVNQRITEGDVNLDGKADIITGAGAGSGPHVRVFSGADLSELASFCAYAPAFAGGVSVGTGDINGDGRADIITGAGPGGGPHVRVFSGADLSELWSFYAYDATFTGGVFVD